MFLLVKHLSWEEMDLGFIVLLADDGILDLSGSYLHDSRDKLLETEEQPPGEDCPADE